MNNSFIQTYTGKSVYPLGVLKLEDVDIRDIAHSLALQCRWRGHCKTFYSIAEHSVHVSKEIDNRFALEGLLHDAAEAYLGDTPSPIKHLIPQLKKSEKYIMSIIAERFNLRHRTDCIKEIDLYLMDELHRADLLVGVSEAEQLMRDTGTFTSWKKEFEKRSHRTVIKCWSPATSEDEFLNRFRELINRKYSESS